MKIKLLSSCCVALLAVSASASAQFAVAPANSANLPQNVQDMTNVNRLIRQQNQQGSQGSTQQIYQTQPAQPQLAPSDLSMKWPDQNAAGPLGQPVPELLNPAQPGLVNPAQPALVEPAVEAKPPLDNSEASAQAWSFDPVQQLRQSGERLERPLSRGIAHSASSSDQARLAQWRVHLLNVGVPASKITFEANRLNREEFELWASRFVWWEQATHPNQVDVGH